MLEIPSRGKRFSLQDRSQRCLFLSATVHELKKVCEICLVGKSLRVSLPLFWIRACPQDIFKTTKGTNNSNEAAEHSSSDISRRYSSDGKNIRGNFNEQRHIDFSASTSEFCHKSAEKISSETITSNRVLGLKIPTHTKTLALTKEKMEKLILKCQNLLSHPQTTVLELTKLIGLMSSTVKAVLPARLRLRYLQQQQIQSINQACSYQAEIVLNSLSKQELLWWVENLRLNNGRSLRQKESNLVIQTDVPKSGWGAFCNGVSTQGKWSEKEENLHINVLELIAAKFAILTFTEGQSNIAIHLQIDNKIALSYLLKMGGGGGGTHNRELLHISKSIWSYLLRKQIAMSAEYLPSALNVHADWESRNAKDN